MDKNIVTSFVNQLIVHGIEDYYFHVGDSDEKIQGIFGDSVRSQGGRVSVVDRNKFINVLASSLVD